MRELWEGTVEALRLILTLDPEIVDITGRSLAIALSACAVAVLISLPLGSLIHFRQFPGKRLLVSFIQTLFSLPTVAVGLFVFILFSRAGPLGGLGLLFTPCVMVVGQVVLVIPIMLGLTISALSGADKAVFETATTMGASRAQAARATIREARFAIMTAVIMGFGRAISEVGIALMVGGNIRGSTRTITTAISLETSKGDIELSMALGLILIMIALVVNLALNRIQGR
jgi:tungstate transport system permease protein